MSNTALQNGTARVESPQLEDLFQVLRAKGYCIVGPTARHGAIVYEELSSAAQLPAGWTDEHSAAKYRLKRRHDAALFSYNTGPRPWKHFLFPPTQRLFRAKRDGKSFQVHSDEAPAPAEPAPKFAFLGVRPCDLHAIQIQDKVFLGGRFVDPGYKARRDRCLIIAVNCVQGGGTCFCASLNTGPKATSGFDLALTEIIEPGRHFFVVECGSEKGTEVLESIPHKPAEPRDVETANKLLGRAAQHLGRQLDPRGLKELLFRNLEHPRWDDVARRCLTCANCTMVCPTCFCSTVEDVTDLAGQYAERWRKWDSCFTVDFSYIHGGSFRATPRSRYRQWLTHKLASWIDQFGALGCVGCGRCIAWCPVGIDLTEEVRALRESDGAAKEHKT